MGLEGVGACPLGPLVVQAEEVEGSAPERLGQLVVAWGRRRRAIRVLAGAKGHEELE